MDPEIIIPESDDALLAECDVETFRAGGKGGQHVDKTESAVRLTHRPSGVVVTCRQERSQLRNKVLALLWLRERLEEMNTPLKERVPTKVPRSVKAKILRHKRIRSERKQTRRKPSAED
jgi:peptide chain release factor 2